ncbi:MAG TPA: transcriptional repressor [Candidatus Intestinimonas pullistercoris]|uniref:Transcriptional repressor n=1 Tax=Candidatus Intestinimonas pullistercoris TaxID=2838623 RepID=A0A9D2P0T8_9FIRM|nr:transcriptional repressor [uncultured Intestinimonas sp.]HJC40554.1 transcriptional repressor [Candidatus Intestinimonas pullistercoris]
MTGKRYSRQRELIYQKLVETDEHPTAEMLYQWLKPENPNLSLGTVYRNLNLLAEEGVIVRMPFPVERYDARTHPHPHFRCKACGRVYDMEDLPYDSGLDQAAEQCSGHQVDRHDLVFFGTCSACTQKH